MSDILQPLCFISIALAFGLGVGPIPNALMGEILPIRIKSLATAIVMAVRYIPYN